MELIEQIIESAHELGKQNRQRDESKGIDKTPEQSAADTNLGMLFDGAEDENTHDNRVRVSLAYRLGYATA
jgi:hypothetical protein